MRLLQVLLWLAIALAAQTQAPIGIIRGTLLECDAAAGELRIRTADNRVYRLAFDRKTYFEREQIRTTAAHLNKGDPLDIVSDQVPGHELRYARTVHVVEQQAKVRDPRATARLRASRAPAERLFPQDDQTFTGVVQSVGGGRLALRTRAGVVETFLLLPDTRFLAGGNPASASALEPYTRVFVRAAPNVDNQMEAFEVVWGDILEPR